jgi:SAM-dependent methyltransferase
MERDPGGPDHFAAEWDERYRARPHLFRQDPDETLVELVAPLRPGMALDLGAGEGRNALWLAGRTWQVVAVDASAVALDRLAASATEEGLSVETVCDDALRFLSEAADRRDSFDLVVVAYLHPPSGDRAHLLRAAAGRVAAGGHLFVVAHHRDSLGRVGPPDPDRLYVEADLEPLAEEGLGMLRLERRSGPSDVTEAGTDVLLWAERPV